MLSFDDFLVEEYITEIFDHKPEAERDEDVEAMAKFMMPHEPADLEVHNVHGMSPMHRVMTFTNPEGEFEGHMVNFATPSGKLHKDEIDPKNAINGYSFIFHKAKEAMSAGKPVKIQAMDGNQIKMYKKVAQRLVDRHGDSSMKVHDMGKQPTVQGFHAHTFVIKKGE